jgi:signal transduction histidine kinase
LSVCSSEFPEGQRSAVKKISIRTRVLTIALVPCFVFLLAGVAGAGYLIYDAAKTRSYYNLANKAQESALPLIISLQEERRLTLRRLASFGTFQSDLIKQRAKTDAVAGEVTTNLGDLADVAPDEVRHDITEFATLMARLPELRARVDGGQVAIGAAFAFYNRIVDQFIQGSEGLALFAPDSATAYSQLVVAPLLTSADLMQRADALAAANMVGGGLTDIDFRSFQGQVSSYHLQLDATIPLTDRAVQDRYAALQKSPQWQRLISVEDFLLQGKTELPISEDLWRSAARDVGDSLMGLLSVQNDKTNAAALDKVDNTLIRAIVAGVLVLLLAAAVFVVALRLSRRLIDRLTRLRDEALDVAEHTLPELVENVRSGADVSVADSLRLLDHGRDEIGEVAEAFNKAQQTAVSAAVQEAKTREGTNKVFLNIAHRSQVIVHRQLKVLDEAERSQEDPEQLEMLFQLDHLSTRARRNAENLIILGGGQPGRRWRNPVSLTELARGAAAETEHFARVDITKLPPRAVNGPVVGDLVHLLAELIDNATSFSPPDSRVEVRGNIVGHGVALEIEDQGLGIESERIDELNTMLASPPDFGIMALSAEPRLGLFVVARLAARHGISVSLRESAYGGTRAIVLVRAELLDEVPETGGSTGRHEKPAADGPVVPRSTVKLPVPVAPDLPPLPIVVPRPGEDLFRPARPVAGVASGNGNGNGSNGHHGAGGTGAHAKPEPPTVTVPPVPAPTAEPAAQHNRPPLPQRRRQQNLAPQLRAEPATTWPDDLSPGESPDQARSRLSAYQRGTRRAREEPALRESTSDRDNTLGSVGNGQHRSE